MRQGRSHLPRRRRRELRAQVREDLRGLDIQPPLDVEDLCRRWGERRGRPVVPRASTEVPVTEAFALWLEGGELDYIVYQRHTSSLHQRHQILHELGHIMAGHASTPGEQDEDEDDLLLAVVPNLPPELVRLALRRHAYDTREEQEAEYIASTILRWAAELELVPVQPASSSRVVGRALGDSRGWW